MIVWLWDVGSAHGVTNDESRAREFAGACLSSNSAGAARVESATLVTGARTLTTVYHRTGSGWSAERDSLGGIRWTPLPAAPAALMTPVQRH